MANSAMFPPEYRGPRTEHPVAAFGVLETEFGSLVAKSRRAGIAASGEDFVGAGYLDRCVAGQCPG